MAKTTARDALVLSPEEQQQLETLAASRTAPLREVQRAKILLGYHAGQNFSVLSRTLRLSRRIIYKHVDRALAAGVTVALRDHPHGSAPTITPEAKAWVLSVACTKPKDLDASYPAEVTIRLILDNHSAHISKETMAYLATRPNRFVYVHTPKHGSWLNLVETLFGKMARTFLRGMRVASWQEMKERILRGVAEINQAPVVHRWSNFTALETLP